MNSFNPDEKHYRCCCNSCHVERGAYIIGIAGIVLSGSALMKGVAMMKWDYVASCVISILSYVSIIYAQKKQNPSLYLPFLILNGIGIVLIGIYIIVMVAMVFMASFAITDPGIEISEDSKEALFILDVVFCVVIAFLAIVEFLAVWFQYVVFRAYKYMNMTHFSFDALMQA